MPGRGSVLFVTEKFPHPVDDGGQIRTWNVLRELARELPVTLLSLGSPSEADLASVRASGAEVVLCGPRRPRWTAPLFAAQALFTRAPYPMKKNFSARLLAEIRRRIGEGGVAALHLNHLDAAQYVEHLGGERARIRAVFDTHNLLSRMYERFAATARGPLSKGYATVQWWKMARFEPHVLRSVDQVLVCSDLERELTHTFGVNGAMVVPNGVELACYSGLRRSERTAADPPTVLFTGALDYVPNADGMRWYLERVLPELRRLSPAVRTVVVGRNPSRTLVAHARPGQVEFTGGVEDVRPYLASSDVAIVPLRVGGGTRLKILEAMAARVPVVSTRIGAEGIAAVDGQSIVLADEPEAFARAVADLCASPAKARAVAAAAADLVARRYEWKEILAPLVESYRSRRP